MTSTWNTRPCSARSQAKEALLRPNENGAAFLALDVCVQTARHGGFRGLALALNKAALQRCLGNVACITKYMCE